MNASPSHRRPWFLALARLYARRRLASNFDGLVVAGLERARRQAAAGPVLIAANHVCFWDPFLVVLLDQALSTESYCLMDRAQLQRLPFFGWLGAVPLERTSARGSLRDLQAALALADRPGRALWIFPQGRQVPAHLRPLGFQRGVLRLARRGLPVLPLSINYAFRESPQLTAAACFGEAMNLQLEDPGESLALLEREVVAGLERIDGFFDRGAAEFAPLVAGRGRSLPLGGRLLAALAQPARAPDA